jgi:hypothetical protein
VSNYPVDPSRTPRFDVTTYLALVLEESGFPVVTPDDKTRLKSLIEGFVYQQPKEATR